VALVTLLSGCLQDVGDAFGGFGWPRGGITNRSQQMYDIWVGATVTAIMVGLLVWGLIFWCVVRYRKRGDELPVQTRYNLPMEVLYTLTPFLVVSVLFYYTAVIQSDVGKSTVDPAVVVEVAPFKWNWQFNYRDGIGPEANTIASTTGSTTEVPVLVLPTGETVRFELMSRDVIHSFWVPELLFKRDVFPGQIRNDFEVVIEVDKEGAYVGRCAELCGTYHSMMTFELRAVDPETFDGYLTSLRSGMSQSQALASVGQEPVAVTTRPFESRRGRD
jgi:cytochrome c oxidase subunit 2